MKTTNDVLSWARKHLDSVRHDLGLIDRGLDPHGDGLTPFHSAYEPPRAQAIVARLGGQEFVLERLIQDITGQAPAPRARKPGWDPFMKHMGPGVPGQRLWLRGAIEIRDEQGAPHPQRWAIVGPLPDGRKVTSNYAETLADAMAKGDEDLEFIMSNYGGTFEKKAVEHKPAEGVA